MDTIYAIISFCCSYDVDCWQKQSSVCQDVRLFFRLRGLCAASVLDTLYRLGSDTSSGRSAVVR